LFGNSVGSLLGTKTISGDRAVVTDSEFVKAYDNTSCDLVAKIRLGSLQHLYYSPAGNRAIRTVRSYIDHFVDEALTIRASEKPIQHSDGKKEQYVFLRELAKDTGDCEVLRDQILSMLLAARDTTASLLSSMFFQLARHPEVYAKLRAEITTLQGRLPTGDDLKEMKYLKWCIDECMWLSTPFSILLFIKSLI